MGIFENNTTLASVRNKATRNENTLNTDSLRTKCCSKFYANNTLHILCPKSPKKIYFFHPSTELKLKLKFFIRSIIDKLTNQYCNILKNKNMGKSHVFESFVFKLF